MPQTKHLFFSLTSSTVEMCQDDQCKYCLNRYLQSGGILQWLEKYIGILPPPAFSGIFLLLVHASKPPPWFLPVFVGLQLLDKNLHPLANVVLFVLRYLKFISN